MQAKKERKQEAKSPIVEIAATRDIEVVKQSIASKYGFMVSDAYAQDLIALVEELAAEMMS